MTGRASRLGRLYLYSKDSLAIAQENFTTEALAIAIEADSRPMAEALSRLDPREADRIGLTRASRLRPETQVALPGGGWLDLVLTVMNGEGRTSGEIWVEVKIGAPESGQQLTSYREHARVADHPVWLITVAPSPLRPDIHNLSWRDLYHSLRHGAASAATWSADSQWRDLGTFLEEQDVANDELGPISDREAASLEAAHDLLQKVSGVVLAAHRSIREGFPSELKIAWTNEGSLLNNIAVNFRTLGEMVATSGPIFYGLASEDGTAYWQVTVDPAYFGRDAVARAQAQVERVGLGSEWKLIRDGGSRVAEVRVRATHLGGREAAIDWFAERLAELRASGIVEAALAAATPAPSTSPASPAADAPAVELESLTLGAEEIIPDEHAST